VTETNKALYRAFIDGYNSGDLGSLDPLVAEDFAHHNNEVTLTLAQFKRGAEWVRSGIPDFQLEIVDLIAEGDRVVARMLGTGTHSRSLYGETPTAARVVLHVTDVVRVEDGRLAEDWETMDELDLRRQLRALPAGM